MSQSSSLTSPQPTEVALHQPQAQVAKTSAALTQAYFFLHTFVSNMGFCCLQARMLTTLSTVTRVTTTRNTETPLAERKP